MRLPNLFLTCWIACATHLAFAEPNTSVAPVTETPGAVRYVDRLQGVIGLALDSIGIRYRRGGEEPGTGFDCSGLVAHVFRGGMGFSLPHSAKQISHVGETVSREDLAPGDLVFFNTMRRTFSHVGIYLGDNLFVHAPRLGGQVRVEDLRDSYWVKHYNGARRIVAD